MLDSTLFGSFTYGLVGTLHCALMCGPIALTAAPRAAPTGAPVRRPFAPAAAYHTSRALGYVAFGAVFGGLGAGFHALSKLHIQTALPFVLAAALLASAFDLFKRAPAPAFLQRALQRLWARTSGGSPAARAGVIGASTALLPCGLLYTNVPVAAASGSAFTGASLLAAFALGTAPSLLLIQWQADFLLKRLGPKNLMWAQRGLAIVAAGALVARALMAGPEEHSCCHHG
jgi:sulfite exporter TauE/SafE